MSEYFRKPIVKTLMLKGQDAVSISDIEKKSTSGLTDTYEITLTDGSKRTFYVSNGKGIKSIAKTSTSGLTDTYTTTYNDGTTSTFTIKNGEKGDTGTVENLEIGVRNLLVKNKMGIGGIDDNGNTTSSDIRVNCGYIDCRNEKNFTIKAHDIGLYKGIRIGVHTYDENKKHLEGSGWINLNVGEKYVITLSDNSVYFRIVFSFSETSSIVTTGGTEAIKALSLDFIKNELKIKVEKTNVASDYTVSPEDIENTYATKSEVTTNTNNISSLTNKVNAINNVSSINTVANMLSAGTSASLGNNYQKTIYNIVVHNVEEQTSILFTLFGASIDTDESYFDILNPAGGTNLSGMCDVKITMSNGTPSAQLIRVFDMDGTDDTKNYRMSIYGIQIG